MMFYAPDSNSQTIEPVITDYATDRDLADVYKLTIGIMRKKRLFHLIDAVQELVKVPAEAKTNAEIAGALRSSYAHFSRDKRQRFLNLVHEAQNMLELQLFEDGKRTTRAA